MINTSGEFLGRVVTAMVTPFGEDKKVDMVAVERLVEHLINSGSSAILVSGTTGESPTLEDAEKEMLLKAVVKQVNKRVKVMMGAGSNDTSKTVRACKRAEELGADALLIVAPYYNKPSQDGLKAHFGAAARATSLPIMLYNIPGRTGITVNPETIVALAAEHKNIVAVKDSTGGVDQAQEIARTVRDGFHIYSGDDNLTLPLLSIGGCGVVSVASHIIGDEIKLMIDSFFAGKLDEARRLQYKNLPIFKGIFIAPNPTCIKYALSRQGICREDLRLPLVPLSDAQKKTMDEMLKDIKVKASSACH
jgi:4-hydroxy-tetrahydrodipicolinate synthase